jgi:AAA domain
MNKRICAAMIKHKLPKEHIEDRLFIIAKGEIKIKMASYGKFKIVEINDDLKRRLIEFVRANRIDVVSIDPFVKSHGVTENDNMDIENVVEAFDEVALEGNVALHLWHHTAKMRGESATVESARGAKALTDLVRSVRILQTMTAVEAAELKIAEPGFYFCAFSGKRNFAPPSESRDWFRLENVDIDNSPLFGDQVGVVTRWIHPGRKSTDLTPDQVETVKEAVRGGNYRAHVLSPLWVGKPIARVLGLDPEDNKATVKAVIKRLLKDAVLKEVSGLSNRNSVVFIEVA